MRRSLPALALALAVAAACGAPPAVEEAPPEPVVVDSSLDRAEVTVGQVATWTVEVEHDPTLEVDLDDPGARVGGVAIEDTRREEETLRSGRVRQQRTFRLRPDVAGSYVLPEVVVRHRPRAEGAEGGWQELTAPRIFLEAKALDVVAAEDGGDIRDIKPLEPRPTPPWGWIAAGVVGALALVAAIWGWRRWRRSRPAHVAPAAPWDIAFARLEALRGLDLHDEATLRRFHDEVSEISRGYVEARFGLNATDMTTEEIVDHVGELGALHPSARAGLLRALAAADRVKFALHLPAEAEVQQVWDDALLVVESTRELPGDTTPGVAG